MMKLKSIAMIAMAASLSCFGRDMAIYNGKLTSAMNANNFSITNAPDPVAEGDMATKRYVDANGGMTPARAGTIATNTVNAKVAPWAMKGQAQPVTAETDPTVPSWAKNPNPPVTVESDPKFTEWTGTNTYVKSESDPTVPAWAKSPTPPSASSVKVPDASKFSEWKLVCSPSSTNQGVVVNEVYTPTLDPYSGIATIRVDYTEGGVEKSVAADVTFDGDSFDVSRKCNAYVDEVGGAFCFRRSTTSPLSPWNIQISVVSQDSLGHVNYEYVRHSEPVFNFHPESKGDSQWDITVWLRSVDEVGVTNAHTIGFSDRPYSDPFSEDEFYYLDEAGQRNYDTRLGFSSDSLTVRMSRYPFKDATSADLQVDNNTHLENGGLATCSYVKRAQSSKQDRLFTYGEWYSHDYLESVVDKTPSSTSTNRLVTSKGVADALANLPRGTDTNAVSLIITNHVMSGYLCTVAAAQAMTNNITFAQLKSKPTTLSGYGITDAYTKDEIGSGYQAKFRVLSGSTNATLVSCTGGPIHIGPGDMSITDVVITKRSSTYYARGAYSIQKYGRTGTFANAVVLDNVFTFLMDFYGDTYTVTASLNLYASIESEVDATPNTNSATRLVTSKGVADALAQKISAETDPTVPSWAKQQNPPVMTESDPIALPIAQDATNRVDFIEGYIAGQRVRVSVTNYTGNTSGELPRLRIEEWVTATNVVGDVATETNYWQIVWDEQDKYDTFKSSTLSGVSAMTNNLWNTYYALLMERLAQKAPRAWGTLTSAGAAAPAGSVWHTEPNTVFAGGTEYAHAMVGTGVIGVLTTKGSAVYTDGETGRFHFTTDDKQHYFGMNIASRYELGCATDGITVTKVSGNQMVELLYNVTMTGKPILYYTPTISGNISWEQITDSAGGSIPGATVYASWDTQPPAGSEICTVNCGQGISGFFKASVEYAATSKFETNMPSDLRGGILATNVTLNLVQPIEPFITNGVVIWRTKQ